MDIDFCSHHLLAYDNSIINDQNEIKAKVEQNLPLIFEKINKLQKEKEDDDDDIIYSVTDENIFNIPRYSRIPKEKKKTKWQLFAENKLRMKKNKSGLIYDNTSKGWVRRFQKKQIKLNEQKNNFVHEYKNNDDIYEDPFEKEQEEKDIKKMKQKMRELKNKFDQKGVSTEDIKYIQRQKRKRENLIDNLKMAQISSSTFGRKDKKLKKEKKLKLQNDKITNQKYEKRDLKDEVKQNNRLAALVLKSV
ncbi:putative nuclear preribosomal assembly protein [Plasmodium gaboni]|uniref:Ribosome biogenesis regulatory protein n=1 Tax=Plasmodium gaboni TaxID=647221 RepID=A0A151LIT6_9APIC|nr:putative nuclear preribosomal assembly protein [Plasmodium gaboni]XP_028538948.1 nuclear preribosomal assembly protein, putative [Plasmodium sp. gorilla clade G2]KYN98890.1 putative nuclear preribosomal assembly protein [Plasmodium gaboni]SOV15704.1 nuclear preribosomal assembly protein, putative [Plasmodium sp. gorilla clade G2]